MSPSGRAFVTFCTEDFVPGALAVATSVRATGSRLPFVVMHAGKLGSKSVEALTSVPGVELRKVDAIANPHGHGEARFANVFTKLNVFALEEFERVAYLDADTLVLQGIEDIFSESCVFAAAPDHGVALR